MSLRFEGTTPPTIGRYGATGVIVKEDSSRYVIFAGGVTAEDDSYSCEKFDTLTETWSSCSETPRLLSAPAR